MTREQLKKQIYDMINWDLGGTPKKKMDVVNRIMLLIKPENNTTNKFKDDVLSKGQELQ